MAESKVEKRLKYTVFSLIFLFGGVEYAVILPTLWLYLHSTYNAPDFMLGLVLSAYSVAAFFSSPFFGRLDDRFRCPKQIFIVCACFELAGSFLYFIGISQWLCLASRFISGLGAAGEATVLAEVSRCTTDKERTSIFSKLVAIRQIALLAAPGLNVVLRLADFNIGPFEVNKYTSPAAFMMVLWILLIFLVLILFKNPTVSAADNGNNTADNGEAPTDTISNNVREDRANYDSPFTPLLANPSPSPNSKPIVTPPSLNRGVNGTQPIGLDSPNFLGTSYDIMVSAEFYMHSSDSEYQTDTYDDVDEDALQLDMNHFSPPPPTYRAPSNHIQDLSFKGADEDYIAVATSALDSHLQSEGRLNFFCNEYIRDEIMAILMLTFCTIFSQICLETMFTPLSLVYLNFGELENSIYYSLCGVVIIAAFVVLSVLSKRISDRRMILFGGFLLLAANIWLIIFLPPAPKHDPGRNMAYFGIASTMDVFSLPFLFVCSASLFSKLTRKEFQGLSQGLRRSVVGLGTIIGPLWASSAVKYLHLMLGVMIGVQALSLLMCICSYKRLKAPDSEESTSEENEAVQPNQIHSESHEQDRLVYRRLSSSSSTHLRENMLNSYPPPSYGTIQGIEQRA